jgi:hypothetical protein
MATLQELLSHGKAPGLNSKRLKVFSVSNKRSSLLSMSGKEVYNVARCNRYVCFVATFFVRKKIDCNRITKHNAADESINYIRVNG